MQLAVARGWPLVKLVDTPGFMVGPAAASAGGVHRPVVSGEGPAASPHAGRRPGYIALNRHPQAWLTASFSAWFFKCSV